MRKYDLTINDKSFSVTVKSFSPEAAQLEINGTFYNVRVDEIRQLEEAPRLARRTLSSGAPAPPAPKVSAAKGTLTAPIPGLIQEVFVKEGDTITIGQPVLRMEAMKMENVINATAAGTVASIRVNPGDTVSQGQELMVIG